MQNTGLLKGCWKFTMYNVLPFQSQKLAGQAEMPSWLPLLFGCTNTFRLWHMQVRQIFKSSLRWRRAIPSISCFGLWQIFNSLGLIFPICKNREVGGDKTTEEYSLQESYYCFIILNSYVSGHHFKILLKPFTSWYVCSSVYKLPHKNYFLSPPQKKSNFNLVIYS